MVSRNKRIFVTSIALRFYEKDGWSENLVKRNLKKGSVNLFNCIEGGRYWVTSLNSELIPELLTRYEFYGQDRWKDVRTDPPILIIEKRNW